MRELRNTLERALLQSDTPHLSTAHVAASLPAPKPGAMPLPTERLVAATTDAAVQPLADALLTAERLAISAALEAHGGSKAAAARALGISRATLYQKLSAHRMG